MRRAIKERTYLEEDYRGSTCSRNNSSCQFTLDRLATNKLSIITWEGINYYLDEVGNPEAFSANVDKPKHKI